MFKVSIQELGKDIVLTPAHHILFLFVIVSALPQSDSETSSALGDSAELVEEAKKAGLPQQSIENCIICDGALNVILACPERDAQCLCGDGLPSRFQSCAQCLVDVGPKTAGLTQEELAKSFTGKRPCVLSDALVLKVGLKITPGDAIRQDLPTTLLQMFRQLQAHRPPRQTEPAQRTL